MISVIIPVLNEEDYIKPLLRSILSQKDIVYEVIIVDGQSMDNTVEVVQKFGTKFNLPIKIIESERGVALQRNLGVTHASYENLLFLDADSVLSETFIRDGLSEMSKRNAVIAGTKIYAVERQLRYRMAYWMYTHFYLLVVRLFNPVLHGCSLFVSKKIHNNIGGFTPDILFEDFDYAIRASKHGKNILLKSVDIRTSARRFYNPSIKELIELLKGALSSFWISGIHDTSKMKGYLSKVGKHPKPAKSYDVRSKRV